jgi:hypothetical protein
MEVSMMKTIIMLALSVAVISVADAEERSVDRQIRQALMPLPEDLRAGATVIGYNAEGEEIVLRRGSTDFTCTADSAATGYFVSCFPNIIAEYRARSAELLVAGIPEDEYRDIVSAEIEAGKLHVPDRSVIYYLSGPNLDNALPLMAIYLPGATAESTGLSTMANPFRPWLMFAGTPAAHIMIPGK